MDAYFINLIFYNHYAKKISHNYNKYILKIISNQPDIKLGQFTQEGLCSVLKKIKNSKALKVEKIPQKYQDKGIRRHTVPILQRRI